jgi:hypothetical protein
MTASILELSYIPIDDQGREVSLLENLYPYQVFKLLEDYVIDAGDFDNATGYGLDVDAGDLDNGTITVSSYSYEAGNFDTGQEVFYPDPPVVNSSALVDGFVDYKDPSRYYLLDADFEPILASEIPRNDYLQTSIIEATFSVDLNSAFTFEIDRIEKAFAGFDYGAVIRGVGYNIDYGSIQTPNQEAYDFNTIVNYQEVYPPSYIRG